MELINYKDDPKYLCIFSELIRDIYNKYPYLAQTKIRDNAFNKDNPFLQFGSWENFLLLEQGKPVAHISAILDNRLPDDVGLVGYFESVNEPELAKKIFDVASNFLAKHQKRIIRGPVNLTTWCGFRVSHPDGNPPFFLEPFTPDYYRTLFEGYGFKIAQSNISTIQDVKESGFDKFEDAFINLKEKGFDFEAIDSRNFLSMLEEIYNLALVTFDNTWTFVKTTLPEFIYYFKNLSGLIDKHFLYIVRNQNQKNVAFFWGMPDFYSKTEKRIILKNMGVLPEYQGLGIGRALFYIVFHRARQEGISKFIFSTMREDNLKIKELTAKAQNIYRKYTVYESSL